MPRCVFASPWPSTRGTSDASEVDVSGQQRRRQVRTPVVLSAIIASAWCARRLAERLHSVRMCRQRILLICTYTSIPTSHRQHSLDQ